MRIDSDNFIYFQDRVGDTFRYITDVEVWQDTQTNDSCPSISAWKDAKNKIKCRENFVLNESHSKIIAFLCLFCSAAELFQFNFNSFEA